MCDPVSLAIGQFAVGAASAVTGYQASSAEAEQQNQYYKNNRIEANRAAVDNYAALQNRQIQEAKAASGEKQELNLDAMKARSTAAVSAGEAGVTGLSVDALIADYYGQEGRYERTIDNNYQMQADYLRGEMESTKHTAEGRINSVQKAAKPSFADAAIRILGSGVDAFGGYMQNKNRGS